MKVLVSAALPGESIASLSREHEVVVGADPGGVGRAGFLAWADVHADAAAIVPLVSDAIDAGVLAAYPALRVVGNYGVGVDNVDLAAARARGVVVCNTPDVLTDATADLAFALLLATARRVAEGDRWIRAGRWTGWSPTMMLGAQVTHGTLGLVGLGRIGRAVARRAVGFSMRVLACGAPGRRPEPAEGVALVELDRLLADSDFVSLHCPLTPATRGLIGADALARMKPGAILVNTARGALVDEAALADALAAGTLGGAGLDVFAHEPRVPAALLDAPNTVLLPHLGSASRVAREGMARLACEAVADVLAGRAPAHRVA